MRLYLLGQTNGQDEGGGGGSIAVIALGRLGQEFEHTPSTLFRWGGWRTWRRIWDGDELTSACVWVMWLGIVVVLTRLEGITQLGPHNERYVLRGTRQRTRTKAQMVGSREGSNAQIGKSSTLNLTRATSREVDIAVRHTSFRMWAYHTRFGSLDRSQILERPVDTP